MKKLLFVWAAFLMVLAPAASVRAEETAKVHIAFLVASNEGNDFDLINDDYRDQLLKLFSYTSYKQIEDVLKDLERSKREVIELPDGYQLILTLQDVAKGRVQIQAMVRKGNQQYLDTVVSILRPGVVFLGGPPAQGGTLIIVLETGF